MCVYIYIYIHICAHVYIYIYMYYIYIHNNVRVDQGQAGGAVQRPSCGQLQAWTTLISPPAPTIAAPGREAETSGSVPGGICINAINHYG